MTIGYMKARDNIKDVPYAGIVRAYRQWNTSTNQHGDMQGFAKFVGVTSFNKYDIGAHAVSRISKEAAQRVEMLLGPNAHALIRAYCIQKNLL